MSDASIPAKSIPVVDKSLTAENCNLVVAFLNGEFTAKFISLKKNKCQLVLANRQKNYPIIDITKDMEMTIWGVVVKVVIDSKNLSPFMP